MTADFELQLRDLDTGKVNRITRWTQYQVTQDLMSPAAAFSATIAATQEQRDFTAPGGQRFEAYSYGALQATGIVDERSEATKVDQTDLQIACRGVGGLLIDSAVPVNRLSLAGLTLRQAAERITEPWQPDFITSVVTNNAANRYLLAGGAGKGANKAGGSDYSKIIGGIEFLFWSAPKKGNASLKPFGKNSPVYRGIEQDALRQTRIQPGEKVWEVIQKLSKQIAAHAWIGADGALVISRPTYDFSPAAYGEGIVLKWDRQLRKATGGNVMRAQLETSIADRHSETIVWGTGKPKKTSVGKQLLRHTWSVKDPSPAFWKRQATSPYLTTNKLYKPAIVTVKNIQDENLVRRVARTQVEQAIIDAFSLEYQLPGHHAATGVLWTVDTMVNVLDQRLGIEDPYYITKVQRDFDAQEGRTTTLKLIPPKIWLYFDHNSTSDNDWLSHMVQRVWW